MSVDQFSSVCYDAFREALGDITRLPDLYHRETDSGRARHLYDSLPSHVRTALEIGDKATAAEYFDSLPQHRRGTAFGRHDVVRCLGPYIQRMDVDPRELVDGHVELTRMQEQVEPIVFEHNGEEYFL